MSEEISSSPPPSPSSLSSSSSSSSSSSKNKLQMKRQNVNCSTIAGDLENSDEVKPMLPSENGYKRRRWSGHNNNNNNNNRSNNNKHNNVSPPDTECDTTGADALTDGADALTTISKNQTSSSSISVHSLTHCENGTSTPLKSSDDIPGMNDQGTSSSDVVLPTSVEMPNESNESTEPHAAVSPVSPLVNTRAQPMEDTVDNDISDVMDSDTQEPSIQNKANASVQQEPQILDTVPTSPTASTAQEYTNNEGNNSTAGAAINRQLRDGDSDDSNDSPPIYIYDSSSSSYSDYLHDMRSVGFFDRSTDDDDSNMTDFENDLEFPDDVYDNADGGADEETNGAGNRKSDVFELIDEVLNKTKSACSWNTTMEVIKREYGMCNRFDGGGKFNNRFYASQFVVERMKRSHCLRRHNGCVNSLNFNRSGTLLCSGSDDKRIVVWDWARNKPKHVFHSGHKENIFQSKFISSGTALDIISAGRDGQVRRTIIPSSGKAITSCLYKHRNAVHKIAICPNSPFEVLSVGEDGYIRYSDLRVNTNTSSILQFVNDNNSRVKVRLFSIAHHPYSPEVCVCGSDEYVRVYDTRHFDKPIHKMHPSHLNNMGVSQVTCCTYNYNGTEVLATYSDEQIYLFDNVKYVDGSFMHVYRGHFNHRTIKGVNFFGPNSEYVISGSDCGNVFFWDKSTEAIVNLMSADSSGVVNCLEPHPSMPVLATSGLEYNVKVWSPGSERTSPDKDKIKVCIMRNIWRSGVEGRYVLDNALNDIIFEAFHPDVLDSDDSISVSSLMRYGYNDIVPSSSNSSTSSSSTNSTLSTENNHRYYAHDSDDYSDNDFAPITGMRCQTH